MKKTKILLLGCEGQVGWELQRSLAPLGEVVAFDRNLDLTQLESLAEAVRTIAPNVIVNAAAHTAVDKAESEPELAHAINATAVGVLAEEAQRLGAWLVHYSTDYVFNGSGTTPWKEDDVPNPLNTYGQTKLEGERLIAERCERHLIFRTSWVYAARGGNFAKTMLRLAGERELMQVINDQFGAPTGAELLADVTAHALRQVLDHGDSGNGKAGIYHLVADGVTTWFDYADFVINATERMDTAQAAIKKIAKVAKMVKELRPVPTSAFPTPAKRPHNSRLDTSKLQQTFGLTLPHWQAGVLRMLKAIQ